MRKTTFTALLRELMGDETQPVFAESIGVSPRMLTYLLNGDRTPGMKVVRGLVARFPGRRREILDAAVNCVRMPKGIGEKAK